VFYSYQSDLGDGWEDAAVHNDPEEVRIAALRMGVNLIMWALSR
jgi:NAD dependent epimerase/dehydratase family enzyme